MMSNPRSQVIYNNANVVNPLDTCNYRIEKLPKRHQSNFERYYAMAGPPLALIAFIHILLTSVMAFSALPFQSQTMIFAPVAIGVARRFGYPVVSLALPVAFMVEQIYKLPFNSKPAALLCETQIYSYTNAFRFGITMMLIALDSKHSGGRNLVKVTCYHNRGCFWPVPMSTNIN